MPPARKRRFSLAAGKTDFEIRCSDELDLERIRLACPKLRLEPIEPDVALLVVKQERRRPENEEP